MAKPRPADLLKAKEAKQKKLLLGLVPVFLLLAVWQGPNMYKQLFAAPASEAAPATATTPAPGAQPAPGNPPAASTGGLADNEPLPTAASDQLSSLSRFGARNPFVPAGGRTTPGVEVPAAAATSADIEVNGVTETVTVSGTFPAADPIFQLVSLSATAAVIGLTSGSFEGGEGTVQIAAGEQVELVADDGATYTVRVVSIG